jgi:hypothetical protein
MPALRKKSLMTECFLGAASGASLSMRAAAAVTFAVVKAARHIIVDLRRGRRIDAVNLRQAMEAAFGSSDARGACNWKTACDTSEAVTVLFMQRYGKFVRTKVAWPVTKLRHMAPVLDPLGEGRRPVVITGANLSPDNHAWAVSFLRLGEYGRVIFSAIDGRVCAKALRRWLFSEIFSAALRVFLPLNVSGIAVLVPERYAIEQMAEQEAAR